MTVELSFPAPRRRYARGAGGDCELHNNLWAARFGRRMTQQELARLIHASRSTISRIESGKETPNLILALKICQALQRPLESVFRLCGGTVQ